MSGAELPLAFPTGGHQANASSPVSSRVKQALGFSPCFALEGAGTLPCDYLFLSHSAAQQLCGKVFPLGLQYSLSLRDPACLWKAYCVPETGIESLNH